MWDWSNIFDHVYFQTCCLQCTNSSFTSCARSFNKYFYRFQSMDHGSLCSCFSSGLSCEWGGFSGTSEAQTTCACPGNCVALSVCNSNNGIVKGRLDMSSAALNIFTFTTSWCGGFLTVVNFSHFSISLPLLLLVSDCFLWTFSCAGIGLGSLSSYRQTFSMTNASVASNFNQSLDVECNVTTKVTPNNKILSM